MGFIVSKLHEWRASRAKARGDGSDIPSGATFARINATHVMETAKVLSVEAHGSGVPHVRFNCRLHRENRIFDDGPRTLALPTFLRRFERVGHQTSA